MAYERDRAADNAALSRTVTRKTLLSRRVSPGRHSQTGGVTEGGA